MKLITPYKFDPAFLTSDEFFWNLKTPEKLQAHPATGEDEFSVMLSIVQNERKLFSLISTTVPTMDGWCSVEKACALAALVMATKPAVIVEIGIWAGRSLLPMAMAAKLTGGKVIGIDPYSPQESAKNEIGENEKWWSTQDHSAIKLKFQQFVKNFGVSDIVTHIEKPSDHVAPPARIDLLHIDGSHTEQAVRDAERFAESIPVGGIVVLDDLMWVGGGVLRAIDVLEEKGFVERIRITQSGECWNIMQKVK